VTPWGVELARLLADDVYTDPHTSIHGYVLINKATIHLGSVLCDLDADLPVEISRR